MFRRCFRSRKTSKRGLVVDARSAEKRAVVDARFCPRQFVAWQLYKKGIAKQRKGLLEVISANVVETQAGENEGIQLDEDKLLVREREYKQMWRTAKGKFHGLQRVQGRWPSTMWSSSCFTCFHKKKVPVIKEKFAKNSSWFDAFVLSRLLVKCRRNTS